MLVVHRGADARTLAGALAQVLAVPPVDPFTPEVVAVPAKGVERWLAQRLSHTLGAAADGEGSNRSGDGICAHVEFPGLGLLTDTALQAAFPERQEAVRAWAPARSLWGIVGLLRDADRAQPWVHPPVRHLGSGLPADADRGRTVATAQHLAGLFDSYGQSRPGMLCAWVEGRDDCGDGTPLPPDLQWQRELWCRLRERLGASPAELLGPGCDRLRADPGLSDLPARVSVFGVSRVAPARLSVLAALGEHRDVHLWVHHCSPALWSAAAAVAPPRSRADDAIRAGLGSPLLASLSRDVLELQYVLRSVPSSDVLHEGEVRPDTLLGRLQRDLAADRLPPDPPVLAPDDRSVAVHACHGRTRQVEVLREAVLGLLAADPTLEPRDVLVMCPDVESFAPLVAAGFALGDEAAVAAHPAARLRVRLADRALRQTNPLLAVLSQLLELGTARISATEVLDLAGEPAVRRRFGFDDDAIERLRDWSAATRVRWGFDVEHRSGWSLPLAQGTWREGMDRLLLGVALDGGGGAVDDVDHLLPVDDVDHLLPVDDVDHLLPVDDVDHLLPVDDVDHLLPVDDVDHLLPVDDVDHLLPVDDVDHLLPVDDVDHLLPVDDVDHLLPVDDVDHLLPVDDVDHLLPVDDVDSADIELVGRFAEFVDRLHAAHALLAGHHTVQVWAAGLDRAVRSLAAPAADADWQEVQLRTELAELAEAAGESANPVALADVRALLATVLAGRPTRASFRTGSLTVCTLVPMRSVPHRVICLLGLDDGVFPRQGARDGDDLLARDPWVGERDARSEDRALLLDAVTAAGQHLVITYTGADERTGATVPPAVPLGELLDALDRTARTADGRPVRDHITTRHPLQPFDPRNFTAGALAPGPFSFDPLGYAGARAAQGPRLAPRPFLDAPLPAAAAADVELADLVRMLVHPARGFLRQRLGVAVTREEEDPADELPVELDGLAGWDVGDRMLRDRLAGIEPAVCKAREMRRGTVPPGPLGDRAVGDIGRRIEQIVRESAPERALEPVSLDVDVTLPDGTRVTGTVPGVRGEVLLSTRYASVGAKHRLQAWIELVALSASRPGTPWTAVLVGQRSGGAERVVLHPLAPGQAPAVLADLVAVHRAGLCEPLPLPVRTAAVYAQRRSAGSSVPLSLLQAGTRWTSDTYPGEQDDAEYRLLHAGAVPIDALIGRAATPADLEPGTGTGTGAGAEEAGRFGVLARRLWGPLLEAERGRST